ncbi:ImmA/IrrE family metallo-endopeptidase [Limnothrix sp. FACHB-881]|uniref:helix-turn-helix domain-containing protein n=1 Tax=Limnothrix sp. FACHB-881 TaxID=2692819 RepID=UPI0016824954|nr:XRE family transcriptional regulator [Limnothrix sp. FACHB-881]MBD2634706.1 ImmA/IrrE family metallo-endopeptidase [Limnothrix sp. FACHB-881]
MVMKRRIFQGEKLKAARNMRGVTAAQLSDLIGVSRQSIYKYERGGQEPTPETLERICVALEIPASFLLSAWLYPPGNSEITFFRSFNSATKKKRDMASEKANILREIYIYLDSFIDFPPLNLPSLDEIIPQNFDNWLALPNEEANARIEKAANETRRFWGLGYGPISNVTWLLENQGILIGRCSLDSKAVDAYSIICKLRPFIILGSDKGSCARSRFDLGHELGHILLHAEARDQHLSDEDVLNKIERQADLFSSFFLFPQYAFLNEVNRPSLELFRMLKGKWKVSIAMMIYRCKSLGVLTDAEIDSMWRNYSRRGWRRAEPFDNEIPLESPRLLSSAIEMLVEESVSYRSSIPSYLNLYSSDIEEICCLSEGYLEDLPDKVISLVKANNDQLSINLDENLVNAPSPNPKVTRLFG